MWKFFASLIFCVLSPLPDLLAVSIFTPSPYYFTPIDLSFNYCAGPGRGYNNGYETVEVFTAFTPKSRSTTFTDIQIHRVDKGYLAANLGLGWRTFFSDNCHAISGAIFYDMRRIRHGNLHQLGFGLELLNGCWDIRANSYIPLGINKVFQETLIYDYSGGQYNAIANRYKRGMWGFDIEVGSTLWCNKCIDIYGAAGPYFYKSICCESLIGGLARIRVEWGRHLAFDAYLTHDQIFGTRYQGQITLSFSFPCGCCYWRSPFRAIQRNPIIVAEDMCCWRANF